MLSIKKLTKIFGSKKILDSVSLEVPKGSIAVLLGSSGVGKSTLLRVLNNLETFDSGSITLDGHPIDIAHVNQTHTIGMVFQHFNLFAHLTALENITLALEKVNGINPEHARETALNLLKRFGLGDKASAYPADLSGGQKQRLALARTIALKPKVLCMDEPTSALDPLLTTHVANTISELAREGYTILIATHDTALLDKLSCTIYLMEGGNIVQSVRSEDFSAKKHAYPKLAAFVAGEIE